MIRTILADDHKLFCDGLERVLNDSGHFQVVQKFYNGQSLLEKMQAYNADLLIIDVEMPAINGFDAIKRIRLNNNTSKIVVLSMHEESVFSQEAFMLGADAYLNKSMESMQLIDSLLKTCQGAKLFPAASMTTKIESPFSEREQEILRLIASGKTSEQIAERLKISHLTVKAHRRNMMRKLNVNNAAELITKALEMGFLYRLSQ
ncbi:response regulator transcription factor [Fulvivirgaceae bacterium PWU4]|uniref:Response regulator transcription factor n=1 Tax=Chryseosolibacter histidini TaxID=2782349 RepID=A0AAP2DMZ6_9BACT|nr:response regulator transcription factor [Chryseosolibacter histidini]MBT1699303.1 response regulator transcription factor [Chryseosolibacter histidini]